MRLTRRGRAVIAVASVIAALGLVYAIGLYCESRTLEYLSSTSD